MTERHDIISGQAILPAVAQGQGRCVVLLHAGVCDSRMWRSTIPVLAKTNRVIAYDRRGYGEARSPDEAFRHVDDLDRVIAQFGCKRAVVVGCSMGGLYAIDYAIAYPGKVAALILVAPGVSGEPRPDPYPDDIAQLVSEIESAEASGDVGRLNRLEAWAWLDGPSSPEGRVAGGLRDLFLDMNAKHLDQPRLTQEEHCPSAMDAIPGFGFPVLVIWGDRDFPEVRKISEWLGATIPGAETLLMEGCAHLPNLEQPERFNGAIAGFLARHRLTEP